MKKLKYLVKYGVKKRLFSKAFVIANIVIGVITLGIMLVPTFLGSMGNQVTTINDEILIVNKTTYDSDQKDLSQIIKDNTGSYITGLFMIDAVDYTVSTNDNDVPQANYYETSHFEKALIYLYRELRSEGLDTSNPNNYIIKVKIYNNGMNEVLNQGLTASLKDINRTKYLLDNQVDNDLIADLIPDRVVNENSGDNQSQNQAMLAGIAPILIIPMFILITFAVQAIGIEIIDEKSSKAIEIIIASVKPTTHFIAKVMSIIIFQTIQMGILLAVSGIGLLINSIISGVSGNGMNWSALLGDFAPMVLPTLALVILCSILGATLYAILGAFIGSISLNQEDYQQTQTPIMMILLIPYVGSIFAGLLNLDWLLLLFTFIPLFAPLSIPVTFFLGYINVLQVILGIVVLIGFIVLTAFIIAPLYKASILSYDQSKLFKRMKNAYKNAKALKENKKLYEENNIDAS